MKKLFIYLSFFSLAIIYIACAGGGDEEKVGRYGPYHWLKGTESERWTTVAEQFGGFSAAMVEVQYRYQELYWAGMDGNWEYADHQIEHIEEAVEAGIQRRPERAASAQAFLTNDIPAMEKVIKNKDAEGFKQAFQAFRLSCNACHAKEEMSFIYVDTPTERLTTVRLPK